MKVPSVANCLVHVTAHAARWSSRSQGLSKGGARALVLWRSPSGRWPPLGAAERSLRADHMWDSPARPGWGAEKESWFLARTRSCLDSCLKRSTMAARQRLPSSSDSHAPAPEDYPDSLPSASLLGNPGGELVEGERAEFCKIQVRRGSRR